MANGLQQSVAESGENQTEDARRLAASRRAAGEREKQALKLQRELILSQRTSSPIRRAALEAALAQIESQLNAIS